jgi:hypothetical protein
MTNTVIGAITVVQYKLTVFIDGTPKPVDEMICERLTQDPHITGFPQIILLNSDHLGGLHPVCPYCGSKTYVKN